MTALSPNKIATLSTLRTQGDIVEFSPRPIYSDLTLVSTGPGAGQFNIFSPSEGTLTPSIYIFDFDNIIQSRSILENITFLSSGSFETSIRLSGDYSSVRFLIATFNGVNYNFLFDSVSSSNDTIYIDTRILLIMVIGKPYIPYLM